MEGNDHEGAKKATAVAGYNDGHKKNTSGYKNDSGYVIAIICLFFFCGVRSRDARSVPSLLLLCLFSSMRIIANKEIPRLRKESLKF